jgi:hypothetical protein
MSADTEVANILSYATNATSSLAASSSSLVTAAVDALNGTIEFPNWYPAYGTAVGIDDGTDGGGVVFAGMEWTPSFDIPEEPPVAFPVWPELTFAKAPSTQRLDEVKDSISAEFPELTLPTFTGYGSTADIAEFSSTVPEISESLTLPTRPNTEIGYEMQLQEIGSVSDPEIISISVPELKEVTSITAIDANSIYQTALNQFMGSIEGDMAPLLASSAAWSNRILDAVLDVAIAELLERLTNSTTPVLSSAAHQELANRMLERMETERLRVAALVDYNRSGWGLPASVKQAMWDRVDQIYKTQSQTVQAGFYTKTVELALALFELYGDLLSKLSTGVASLYSKAIELTLETHRITLIAAQKTIASLLKLHELLYVTLQEFDLDVAETKLSVAESELTAAMIKFEIAKLSLEVEQAKLEHNEATVEVLRAQAAEQEARIKVYAADISATRAQIEAIRLSADIFELKVRAFEAKISAMQAKIEVRIAEIENDSSALEAKLLVVKEYEEKVDAFGKLIAAKSQISQSQAERNAAVIDEFTARVKGVLAPLEQSVLTDEYELQKYSVLAENVITDARIAEKNARARIRFSESKQDGNREAYRFTAERAINLMKAELDRVEAISSANEQGARIMSNMALSAMSSANAVAHTIISETE